MMPQPSLVGVRTQKLEKKLQVSLGPKVVLGWELSASWLQPKENASKQHEDKQE